MVVTGSLNLYGNPPSTVNTYLKESAIAGSSSIVVNAHTDWAVGDTIVISSSFTSKTEHESMTIASIDNATKTVTFTSALQHTHYGASG